MLKGFAKILAAGFVGFILWPTISFAQTGQVDVSYALSSELGVEIIPNYPKPNEVVFINLSLYTEDLNSANITWYKDGKNVLSGKGETKFSFRAGNVGQSTNLEVVVRLLSGLSISKNIFIKPARVDLVWESNSYVPPFYKGKALHPRQGGLRVVAMPEFIRSGQMVSPQNLVYEWSNGINVYKDRSGYGKNVLVLDGSLIGREEKIEVLVTDPINNMTAQGFVEITPIEPEIVFYENSPYYGHIFDLAIPSVFDLKSGDIQILAAPFYFTKETEGLLQSEWRLNNQLVQNLVGSRTAIFRKPENETGSSVISLQITNLNRILQQAESHLTMNFEK